MTRAANALVWPAGAAGQYRLSAGQMALLVALRSMVGRRRTTTLEELATWSGTSSRGRAWERLSRLRGLGLVGFKATRGRSGSIRFWLGPKLARGVYTAGARRRAANLGNDSVSPYGGYLTREETVRSWSSSRSRRRPPGSPGPSGLTGPRRGRDRRPPRVLWSRCPSGHRVTIGRFSWRTGRAQSLHGDYRGWCRRCKDDVVEVLDLWPPPPPARALSPAELEDPALRARRVAAAASWIADPGTSWAQAEQLRRDYPELDPDAGPTSSPDAESAAAVLDRLFRPPD